MSPAEAAAGAAGREYTPDTPEIALIKHFEGYTPTAKPDFGQTSIGYSTKAAPGQTSIDRGEAEVRLREEVAPIRDFVDRNVPNASPSQRSSMISAGFNLGTGPGGLSDMMPEARAGDFTGASNRLLRYNRAGGEVNPGLTSRRGIEAGMLREGGSPAAQPQPQANSFSPSAPATAAPGPDFDAGIRIAAQNGDTQTMALLQNAKQEAMAIARQGRLDERQLANDARAGQAQDIQLQEARMRLADKLAMKAAGVAQMIQAAPAEQKAAMAGSTAPTEGVAAGKKAH